jgi:hypothetical protein
MVPVRKPRRVASVGVVTTQVDAPAQMYAMASSEGINNQFRISVYYNIMIYKFTKVILNENRWSTNRTPALVGTKLVEVFLPLGSGRLW